MLQKELDKLQNEGLELQGEIRDNEALLAEKRKALTDIARVQERIEAVKLSNSRLKDSLNKTQEQVKGLETSVGDKDVEQLHKDLQKAQKDADDLKKKIDEANAKYADLRSKSSTVHALEERIARQKDENDKYKAQLDVTLERIKAE